MDWRFVVVAGFAAWLSLGVAIGAVLSPMIQQGFSSQSAASAGARLADASR